MLHDFRRSFGCLCFDVVHAGQIDWNYAEEIEGADVENHLEVGSSDCGLPSRLKRHELQALEANLAIDSNAIRVCTDHNASEAVCDSNNSVTDSSSTDNRCEHVYRTEGAISLRVPSLR